MRMSDWSSDVTCSLLTQLSYSQQEAVLPLSWLGGGQKPSWTCQEGSEMAETTKRSNTTTPTIRLTSEEAETVRSAAAARGIGPSTFARAATLPIGRAHA